MIANCNSPLGVSTLMECYYSNSPIGNGSPAVKDLLTHFVAHGLIEARPEPGCYQTTDKGAFHVNALKTLPFPIAQWKTPNQ